MVGNDQLAGDGRRVGRVRGGLGGERGKRIEHGHHTGRGLQPIGGLGVVPHRREFDDLELPAINAQAQGDARRGAFGIGAAEFAVHHRLVQVEELPDVKDEGIQRDACVRDGKGDLLPLGDDVDGGFCGAGEKLDLLEAVPEPVGGDLGRETGFDERRRHADRLDQDLVARELRRHQRNDHDQHQQQRDVDDDGAQRTRRRLDARQVEQPAPERGCGRGGGRGDGLFGHRGASDPER